MGTREMGTAQHRHRQRAGHAPPDAVSQPRAGQAQHDRAERDEEQEAVGFGFVNCVPTRVVGQVRGLGRAVLLYSGVVQGWSPCCMLIMQHGMLTSTVQGQAHEMDDSHPTAETEPVDAKAEQQEPPAG